MFRFFKRAGNFFSEVFRHYINSNTFEKGAALSYYAAFSFIPIIMILLYFLGVIFKEAAINGELGLELASIVGNQGAEQIEELVRNQHLSKGNTLTTIIGIVTLALAATGVFNQIQKSMNAIWGLTARPRKGIINYLARRLTSLIILVIIGGVLILSTGVNIFFLKYSDTLPSAFENAQLYENILSYILITFMFTILFRFHANAIVPWKTALVSAGFTTVLFFVGKIAIGLFITYSKIQSTFGAASMIAVLMIWVYYTSQILFIGASFAYVFGKRSGQEIKPSSVAVRFIQKLLD